MAKSKKIKLLLVGIGLSGIVTLLFYLKLPEVWIQASYPKTSIAKARMLVVKAGVNKKDTLDGVDPSKSNFNTLTLLEITGEQKTETVIENFKISKNVFFQGAIMVDDIVYYLLQNNKSADLVAYDVTTSERRIIDTFSGIEAFNPFDIYVPKDLSLLYDDTSNEIVVYHQGKLRIYSARQNRTRRTVQLWDESPYEYWNYGRNMALRPDMSVSTAGSGKLGSMDIINGQFMAVFDDLYTIKDIYAIPVCRYENLETEISFVATENPIVECSISSSFLCSVRCLDEVMISRLDGYDKYHIQRSPFIAMLGANEFIIKNDYKTIIDMGGGGAIGPRFPSIDYKVNSSRMVTADGIRDIYKKINSGAWHLDHLVVSSDKKMIAFADSEKDGWADVFVLDLEGKKRPILIMENAYPLFIENSQ